MTFTKKALKTIREKGIPTRVTQIPLTPVAGKYSYPFETKKEMFETIEALLENENNKNIKCDCEFCKNQNNKESGNKSD